VSIEIWGVAIYWSGVLAFSYDKAGQSHYDNPPTLFVYYRSTTIGCRCLAANQTTIVGDFIVLLEKIELVFASTLSVNYLRLLNKIDVCQGPFHMSKCNVFFYSISLFFTLSDNSSSI
jgi:hypothetical protein